MDNQRHENIPVRIAISLRQQAEELAQQQGVSLNHFVTVALVEKVERMMEREQRNLPQERRLSAG